jgi:hypothetical protein
VVDLQRRLHRYVTEEPVDADLANDTVVASGDRLQGVVGDKATALK